MNGWETGSQGTRDGAMVLPFVAIVLIFPPVILIFAAPLTFAGIPLIVVYIFVWWLGVVICAWLLARKLKRTAEPHGDEVAIVPPSGNAPEALTGPLERLAREPGRSGDPTDSGV